MYAGFFRFVADLDSGWKAVASADFGRWLLQAMSLPHLRGETTPDRFVTPRTDETTALNFLGYSHDVTADDALLRGFLYGPLALVAVALLAMFRLLYVQRH